jgi:hypothetical protein
MPSAALHASASIARGRDPGRGSVYRNGFGLTDWDIYRHIGDRYPTRPGPGGPLAALVAAIAGGAVVLGVLSIAEVSRSSLRTRGLGPCPRLARTQQPLPQFLLELR